jgi:hypothetical protein
MAVVMNFVPVLLLFYGFSWRFQPSASSRMDVCESCTCYDVLGISVVNCSSSGVPKIIPDGTNYL